MNHYDYMSLAMQEAKKALTSREIPIGAIIVLHDSVIAAAHNQCENRSDPTAHAEILAIKKASAILGNWRLTGCSLYVTIEPCPMCAGAAVNAHLSSIIYGAPNPRYGGIDSKFRIVQNPFNHAVSVIRGVCQSECQQLMDEFSMINVIYPCDNCIMERYRSGHNEADSKSVVQQCTVGSNPTRSAIKSFFL